MNILIAGGTGFIGQALAQYWLAQEHHTLTILGRSEKSIKILYDDQVKCLTWYKLSVEDIENHNLIINLCGLNLANGPWSATFKQKLLDSRIQPTQILSKLLAQSINKPPLFNASGVSTYGPQTPATEGLPPLLDESTPINFDEEPDFLSTVGRRWEKATKSAVDAGVRVVMLRIALVLGKGGGALSKMKWPYLLGLGGPIGNGRQPLSWVALSDLVQAIDFLAKNEDISGPVNLVSPNTVQQRAFAKTLGHVLHRPAILPMPAFMVKALFGQMGEETLLTGNNIAPKVLLDHGFQFGLANLEEALKIALC